MGLIKLFYRNQSEQNAHYNNGLRDHTKLSISLLKQPSIFGKSPVHDISCFANIQNLLLH